MLALLKITKLVKILTLKKIFPHTRVKITENPKIL